MARLPLARGPALVFAISLGAAACTLRSESLPPRPPGPPPAPHVEPVPAALLAAPTPTPEPTATPAPTPPAEPPPTPINLPVPQAEGEDAADQRTIAGLRARAYGGGAIEIVRPLAAPGAYTSYVIRYPSDDLVVTGFLNVPRGDGPFPVLLINHGYVNPAGYAAVASNYAKREGDFFAARGYLTAGSDYRGHGNSPGTAPGGHVSPAYVIDVLNLLELVKQLPQADGSRIGVWGHSMGGSIAERMMVVSKDVRATVIWAGVSADAVEGWLYLRDWIRRPEGELRARFGHPDEQADLYRRMSARAYLADVAGPVQIHHGTADASVPYQHAVGLARLLAEAGKPHEFYTYPGAPHNWFGPTWDLAAGRTLAFFDRYVKG